MVWLAFATNLLGAIPHDETTELVVGVLSAALGVLCGVTGLRRMRGALPRTRRGAATAVLVVLAFTAYACVRASMLWGGFAIGELARALSYGVFVHLVTARDYDGAMRFLTKAVHAVAFYGCAVLLLYDALGAYPPGYEPVVEGVRLEGLHLVPATIFFAAIAAEVMGPGARIRRGRVALFLAAQCVEGHASLALAAFVTMGFVVLTSLRCQRRTASRPGRVFGLLAAGVAIGVVASVRLGLLDAFLESEAFSSRVLISARRIADLEEHPWFGLGSPGRTASIALDYSADAVSRFTDTVRVADFGYLDVLLRYGVVLGALYLGFWLYSAYVVTRAARSWRALWYPASVVAFLFVNITLSVFTFGEGLFSLFVMLAISGCRDGEGARVAPAPQPPCRARPTLP